MEDNKKKIIIIYIIVVQHTRKHTNYICWFEKS